MAAPIGAAPGVEEAPLKVSIVAAVPPGAPASAAAPAGAALGAVAAEDPVVVGEAAAGAGNNETNRFQVTGFRSSERKQ